MDSILFLKFRQDLQDYQDNFFVFINFRKKLMKHNPPSVKEKIGSLLMFLNSNVVAIAVRSHSSEYIALRRRRLFTP